VILTIAKNPGSILAIVGRSESFWVSRERRPVGGKPRFSLGKMVIAAALLKIICGMKQPEIAEPTRHWPAEQIEHWPIERLKLYANNPRLHTEADLGKIAASTCKWDWTTPVLVDEHGQLICGHARVGAAMLLELNSILVIVAKGWSEEEKRAYRVACSVCRRGSASSGCRHGSASSGCRRDQTASRRAGSAGECRRCAQPYWRQAVSEPHPTTADRRFITATPLRVRRPPAKWLLKAQATKPRGLVTLPRRLPIGDLRAVARGPRDCATA